MKSSKKNLSNKLLLIIKGLIKQIKYQQLYM